MAKTNLFNQTELWENYGLTPDYLERIEIIHNIIPKNVGTLLDLGCGKGDIINAISKRNSQIKIWGIDLSQQALKYAEPPVAIAGLPNTPFKDNSFEIVLCLQVLEHIHEAEYLASLDEIERLANRYLIIGVPFQENLLTKQVLCANCGKKSHADGHLRSYDRSDIHHLFNKFILEREVLCGVLQKRRSKIGGWFVQRLGGIYYQPESFYCPHCGSNQTGEYNRPAVFRKSARLFDLILSTFKRPRPYWIIALYSKKDA